VDPLLGTIIIFASNFAPVGWALCNGQILPITGNTAVFSLLGTTYGGDGMSNFALPDLRGRVPIGAGQGIGLSNYVLGQTGGLESVILTQNQLPAHTHGVNVYGSAGTETSPAGNLPAATPLTSTVKPYSSQPPTTTMNSAMIASVGNGAGVSVLQPFLTVNYIIALLGIFPSRN
jgi:microcystin-dependent protein